MNNDETNDLIEKAAHTPITKKDVRKSWFYYYLVAEMGISYERLQALGFATSMIPILRKLYPDKVDFADALQRHLIFYNTEVVFGSPINGMVIAMEEQKAQGEPVEGEAITGIKTGLMGPLAGIGDSFDWAILKPIIFGLGASLSATGSILGAFVMLLLPIIQIMIGLKLSVTGYEAGRASIKELLQSGKIKQLITGASTMGLFMMGALSSTYVEVSTPISFSFSGDTEPFVLQDVLDGIIPGLLPLAVVLGIYWWLLKKNQNFAVIMLLLIGISLFGAFFGII